MPLDNGQLALAFYNAARAEVVQRLALREQTLLAWITTMGVVIGFSASKTNPSSFDPKLIRLVPLLCLPFGLMIHRHNLIIRYIGEYIRGELNPHLRQHESVPPSHWDNSKALRQSLTRFLIREVLIYQIMQIAVPCACIYYLHSTPNFSWKDRWIEAGIASIFAVFGIGVYDAIQSYRVRRHSHSMVPGGLFVKS